jgi:hypothetical protein
MRLVLTLNVRGSALSVRLDYGILLVTILSPVALARFLRCSHYHHDFVGLRTRLKVLVTQPKFGFSRMGTLSRL